jgi:uncharacterized protein (TIGR04222 family)
VPLPFDPFALSGPRFLLFYLVLGVVVLALIALPRWMRSGAPAKLSDPYAIACLRGGEKEAAQAAAISLAGRGLLVRDGSGEYRAAPKEPGAFAGHRLERAILGLYAKKGSADALFRSPDVALQTAAIRDDLRARGLLYGGAARAGYAVACILLLGGLLWVGAHRIELALARGRSNIVFLILEMAAFAFAGLYVAAKADPRTPSGLATLSGLKELFSAARDRRPAPVPAPATAAAMDPVLLFAVYGSLLHMGGAHLSAASSFRPPRPAPSSSARSGSTCGSSCGTFVGTSCGSSSCGSSCGGGGCGGGCGGCGGG